MNIRARIPLDSICFHPGSAKTRLDSIVVSPKAMRASPNRIPTPLNLLQLQNPTKTPPKTPRTTFGWDRIMQATLPEPMPTKTFCRRPPPQRQTRQKRLRVSSMSWTTFPRCRASTCGRTRRGQVIYVGKAKQLRARMRQYVNFQDERAKIPLLVEQIDSFEYLVVDNEHESLVLEKNLINQHAPFFNADFKDDKSYPFIALTKGDAFPAIKYTREKPPPRHHATSAPTPTAAPPAPWWTSPGASCPCARPAAPTGARSRASWRRRPTAAPRSCASRGPPPPRPSAPPVLPGRPFCDASRACFDAHVGLPCLLRQGHAARSTPPACAADRALPGRPSRRVRRRAAPPTCRRPPPSWTSSAPAGIKARIDTINSLADKQHAVSSRNLDADVVGLFREETVAGGARAHGARGPHHQLQRVRLEPRHRRARSGPAAQLPAALLRRHHLHPARGDRARAARGRRGHGGLAHREAGQPPRGQGALHRAAEGGEGRASWPWPRPTRSTRSHALQGAHQLRRQAHQQRASAAGERPGLGRAAHAHRVLRHLHHPRLLHRGLHGGVHRRASPTRTSTAASR